MGTRSTTIIMEENQELVRIYRQMDGYPSCHGVDLAKLCSKLIVSGFGGDVKFERKTYTVKQQANGMGCLAAQIIAGLKDGIGNIYLEPVGGEINDWCEYVYIVRGGENNIPTIECTTQTGPWPFNMQDKAKHVFTLRADKVKDFVKETEAA